ncbi:MAG: MFS family permease [Gammaproteobacteria bacterium]|jgi:MFS family permease
MITPYLIRSFLVSVKEAGIALGILIGVFGGIGTIVMGVLCDRLSKRSLLWRPRMIMIATVISLPFQSAFLWADDVWLAYAFYAVPSFLGLLYASLAYTAMQELFPLRMRAFASALMLLCLTLVGIGGGPVIVGVVSDLLKDQYGEDSLRFSLLVVLIFAVWSRFHLRIAERVYLGDIERAGKY